MLRLRNVRLRPRVEDVSLDLHPGEILGLAGLVGSGRTEVARIIFGAERPERGSSRSPARRGDCAARPPGCGAGVALLPEDRRHEGLIMNFSVRENLTLATLPNTGSACCLSPAGRAKRVPRRRRSSASRSAPPSPTATVSRLSGGNQQKVVLGKWLQRRRADPDLRRTDPRHRRRCPGGRLRLDQGARRSGERQ